MVYENELWHSFLLRSQIMYNLSNCRNIISKHGALRYDAFPRFELIDMYKLHSLQDIYDILATRNGYILTSNIVSLSSGVYGYFNAVEDACRKNFHITNSYPLVNISNIRYWICPYISRHLLSLNPLLACCRRYSRGER